jgi:hypothetical protein
MQLIKTLTITGESDPLFKFSFVLAIMELQTLFNRERTADSIQNNQMEEGSFLVQISGAPFVPKMG